jgi:DNA-binding NtrC family response regulator
MRRVLPPEEGAPMSDKGAPIYVVDDDVSVREGVESLIRSAGLRAETFASAREFLARRQSEAPSCLVLDVEMPGLSGLDLQEELAKADVQIPIIFLTGHGNIPMTVRAIKAGALEFLTKPFDDEDLLHAIRQGIGRYQTAQQHRNAALEDEIPVERNFEGIIGKSPRLKDVLESVRTVAPADSTVLIQGETGTGKELIAHAIHDLSPRKGQAFVKVNCAAIPSGLLESELFGHEKGAFTGAIAQKIGRFEVAHKGTLFLDEIGDIPLELQPKLLRVLQEQEFERLGSTRTQRVDVRLLAATNVGLTQMVAEKKFRSDLYYRLNVFPIDVPPLRDRHEDIPLLVRHFASKYARRMGKQIESIPAETMDALSRYAWPGNIRELQNLMERAVLLSKDPSLRVPLGEIFTDSDLGAISGGNALEQAEREQIVRALRESNWVVGGARGAAARLGVKRTALAYKVQKFGIVRPPQ